MKKIYRAYFLLLLILFIVWYSFRIYTNNILIIKASITTYPYAIFHSNDIVWKQPKKILMTATANTFEDLASWKADIIFVTEPNSYQYNLMNNSEKKIWLIPISTENVVVLVNKNNPISNISSEDLKLIYTQDKDWSDFWWDNKPIISYQIAWWNWSATVFEKLVKWSRINAQHIEEVYMDKLIDDLWNNVYGIWYAFQTFFSNMYPNDNLKIIKVNGLDPEDRNYLLKSNIFLWFDKDNEKIKNINL